MRPKGLEFVGEEGATPRGGVDTCVMKVVLVVNCTFTIVTRLVLVVYWTAKIVTYTLEVVKATVK